MYRFSKQGKHFMKSMTTSKLRLICVKAKTFTLGTGIVELATRDPCVKHESLRAKRIASPHECERERMQRYLKNCGAKLDSKPILTRELPQNIQFRGADY
jgi:hypothetical protein